MFHKQVTVTDDDARSHSHVDLDLSPPQTPPLSEPGDEVIFEPDEDEPPSKSYVERRNRDRTYIRRSSIMRNSLHLK